MKTRTDRHGNKLCEVCGVAAPTHTATGCEPTDVLHESIRKVVARAMAQRQGADVATDLTVGVLGEWLRENGYAIVSMSLEIVEVG